MDPLSDVLRIVGLAGGVFMEADFTAPWAVVGRVSPEFCRPFMAPPPQVIGFHYVVEGGMRLTIEGAPVCDVSAGQVVMMPHNDLHVFGSPDGGPPVRVDELTPVNGAGVPKIVHGGDGARTRVVCGFLGGNDQLDLLLASLPRALTIDVEAMSGGDWIGRTFRFAAQTLSDGDPGAATVVTKLSELLFVESVRHYLAHLPEGQTGWLAALRDPTIGRALAMLHARVAEPWTAEALAREVGMSRSAFADRFGAVMGQPPIRYLTGWRMQLARQKLRDTRLTIAQIAFDVGYDSEASFTRAFRRECGTPPAAWRRAAGANVLA